MTKKEFIKVQEEQGFGYALEVLRHVHNCGYVMSHDELVDYAIELLRGWQSNALGDLKLDQATKIFESINRIDGYWLYNKVTGDSPKAILSIDDIESCFTEETEEEMKKAMTFNGSKLTQKSYDCDSYDFISDSVGGYIESIPLSQFNSKGIDVWCNENGKYEGLLTSMLLSHDGKIYDNVVGDVVFTRCNEEGETISLTDDDIKFINEVFDKSWYHNALTGEDIIVLNY